MRILVFKCNIACGIGILFKLDKATTNGDFGHYARVLIELDVSVKSIDSLMNERVGKSFFIKIAYENLSAFCSMYSFIGHVPSSCKLNKMKEAKPATIVGKDSRPQQQKETLPKPIPQVGLDDNTVSVANGVETLSLWQMVKSFP